MDQPLVHSGRVLVAMSGGVDSSVAAALLSEAGYECSGAMMRLHDDSVDCHENACCKKSDIADAYAVAKKLNIPFHVLDFSREFESEVIEYFCRAYEAGLTPNPCIACNRAIKFGLLHGYAQREGFDFLATGHYARVEQGADNTWQLLRGVDQAKDQSYVLYMANQEQLSHLLLPLGRLTKAQVRRKAAELELKTAHKAESQDICFVGPEGYVSFLEHRRGQAFEPGPIVTREGQELGSHRGLAHYTDGQRKGLGIAAAQPLYVLERKHDSNTLVVGSRAELGRSHVLLHDVSWIDGRGPQSKTQLDLVVRYQGRIYPASIVSASQAGRVELELAHPCYELAAGQSGVLYQGERLLGGGIIAAPRQYSGSE